MTRETVHFQTGDMQNQIRILAQEVDEEVLLEAFGVAALANSIVRLAALVVHLLAFDVPIGSPPDK